ncbi:MAG: hypothetical protein ABI691_25135 [Ginsengibacter sp.]
MEEHLRDISVDTFTKRSGTKNKSYQVTSPHGSIVLKIDAVKNCNVCYGLLICRDCAINDIDAHMITPNHSRKVSSIQNS